MNKRSFITILLTVLMCMSGANVFAHDIEAVNNDGVTIYYIWENDEKTMLSVSFRGSDYNSYSNEYTGNVVIPESVDYNGEPIPVTSIDYYAFCHCSDLTSVTIPNSVTFMGYWAFGFCSGLTSVTIPASVTRIENSFAYCSSLTSITVDEANTDYKSVDGVLMSKDGTVLINYPAGKTETAYTIPNSVTSISSSAFADCSGLESVTIPNSVTFIDYSAFQGCSNLTSVIIPNGVTEICDGVFNGCSSLSSVTIPNSVTKIGSYAFDNSGLTSITIPSSVTEIDNGSFRSCFSLSSITVDEANTAYRSVDGVLMSKDGTTLIAYPAGKDGYSYTIPDGVTIISNEAFYSSILSDVTIPSSVTKIGEYAFDSYNLFDVSCHTENVLSAESNAFYTDRIVHGRLHVPGALVRAYSVAEPWNQFGTVLPLENDGIILNEHDLNYDNKVNVADIAVLIDEGGTYPELLDLTGDSQVDASDVAVLVDDIMKSLPPTNGEAPAGVVAVDLGLPSGTKWANMNVGAEKPEDYGLYYAWGETTGYKRDVSDGHFFFWETYKYMNDIEKEGVAPGGWQVSKYQVADGYDYYGCWYDSEGKFIGDRKRTLDLDDDAAYMNWGSNWRMPTIVEIKELLSNTTSEMTTLNGVSGCKFTAPNGNSIFLPHAGSRIGEYPAWLIGGDSYWSSTICERYSGSAYNFFLSGETPIYRESDRCVGLPVRPVLRE